MCEIHSWEVLKNTLTVIIITAVERESNVFNLFRETLPSGEGFVFKNMLNFTTFC